MVTVGGVTTESAEPGRSGLTRRAVASGVGVGLALPVLAACAGESSESAQGSGAPAARVEDAPTTTPAPSAEKLVDVADVPVGGGLVVDGVVVSQPEEGRFRAFKAVCTHQQCAITRVTETIDCTCHFSLFSLEDGSVVDGPADKPLPGVDIVVDGDAVYRA